MDRKPTYICDPKKNVNCPKDICQALGRGECKYTSNPEFAVNPDQPEVVINAFNESFEKKQTNQDKLAETIRTMDAHKLGIFITNGIECPNCPAEKYCDQHTCTTEDGWSRVPDANGEILDCNQIFERWLKEDAE